MDVELPWSTLRHLDDELRRRGWTAGHPEWKCIGCGVPTALRSPSGHPWHPAERDQRGQMISQCRTRERWMRFHGCKGLGSAVVATLPALALPFANPDPVAAAREQRAIEEREGDDVWPEGRE